MLFYIPPYFAHPKKYESINLMLKLLPQLFRFTAYFCILSAVIFLAVIANDAYIKKQTTDAVFNQASKLPDNKVGLLLGTSKFLKSGYVNLYYKYRIDATVALYQSCKIEHILISGDNSTTTYDEPTTMKNDLIKRGIPASKIHLDYAGFRTLDSVLRMKKVFGESQATVISQPFHNERAVYIAQQNDINLVAYNAKDVSFRYGKRIVLREKLARVKMQLDLLFGVQPKFLGKRIVIG